MSQLQPEQNRPEPRTAAKVIVIPRYMGTFADLMTLLLCFFVLLVAMAEIDALKFKMVVRTMEDAFGVERPKPEDEIVKGTSVIQQRFSPNPDQPTPIEQVRQAGQSDKDVLKTEDAAVYQAAQMNSLRKELAQFLAQALDEDLITLETMQDRVLIRINEQASFASAGANLKPGFVPVLDRIANALADIDAQFVVAGHTDNVPLRAGLYRSNWDLSGARATSVVHALLRHPGLGADQFRIEAYADTQPLKSNDSAAGRAVNRRVEIGIIKPWSQPE
jgi:chemotaxis protein MotB